MKEKLINFGTAKLAKEKGFDIKSEKGEVMWYYSSIDTNLYTSKSPKDLKLPHILKAPTQSLLQCWLREVHNIHIEILLGEDAPYNQFYYRLMKLGQYFTLSHDGFYRYSYEEVLEEALQQALIKI